MKNAEHRTGWHPTRRELLRTAVIGAGAVAVAGCVPDCLGHNSTHEEEDSLEPPEGTTLLTGGEELYTQSEMLSFYADAMENDCPVTFDIVEDPKRVGYIPSVLYHGLLFNNVNPIDAYRISQRVLIDNNPENRHICKGTACVMTDRRDEWTIIPKDYFNGNHSAGDLTRLLLHEDGHLTGQPSLLDEADSKTEDYGFAHYDISGTNGLQPNVKPADDDQPELLHKKYAYKQASGAVIIGVASTTDEFYSDFSGALGGKTIGFSPDLPISMYAFTNPGIQALFSPETSSEEPWQAVWQSVIDFPVLNTFCRSGNRHGLFLHIGNLIKEQYHPDSTLSESFTAGLGLVFFIDCMDNRLTNRTIANHVLSYRISENLIDVSARHLHHEMHQLDQETTDK